MKQPAWTVTKKVIKHVTTEGDNETYDIVRISFFLSVVGSIIMSAVYLWTKGVFDVFAFSTGMAALLGGGGAGMGARARLEGPAYAPLGQQPIQPVTTSMPIKPSIITPAPDDDGKTINPPGDPQ